MNVLSLFDGMSCGHLALDRAGISVDNYYASELDKYAIQVTQANYPDTIQLGDVNGVDEWELPKIDLLIGGSPCQGFSFAGKQLAFDDPRSQLFFKFVDALKRFKPKYFLLENVRMKKEYLDIISEYLGVQPIQINSALVSAQNRVRYYWTNIPNVTQPEDKGILLKDIVLPEDEITSNFIHTDKAIAYMNRGHEKWGQAKGCRADHYTQSIDKPKAFALTANFGNGVPYNYFQRPCEPREYNENSTCHHAADATDIKGNESIKRVYAETGKPPTLTTMGGGHREPKVLCGAMRGRYLVDGKRQDGKMKTAGLTKQYIEVRHDEKTNTLTTVTKDNNVVVTDSEEVRHEVSKLTYRKLTPVECERLQTVPDNYTNHVSNTQRYKMLGNGWTVDVIAHIFKGIKDGGDSVTDIQHSSDSGDSDSRDTEKAA